MNSKKQFDHIEERIKQAAGNNLPAFDEKGWQLMEAKLDNENRKRRPFLWWIVLPLLIAGTWGGYQLLKTPGKEIAKVVAAKKVIDKQDDKAIANLDSEKVMVDESNDKNKNAIEVTNDLKKASNETIQNENSNKLNTASSKTVIDKTNDENSQLVHPAKTKGTNKGKIVTQASGGSIDDAVAGKGDAVDLKSSVAKADKNAVDKSVNDVENVAANDKPAVDETKPVVQQKADDKKLVVVKEEVKQEKKKEAKEKDKKSNKGFYILATGGTDAGSTRLFSYSNCSIKPKYGIGVGYQLGNRFSVQTGFYASSKKYVAGKAITQPSQTLTGTTLQK